MQFKGSTGYISEWIIEEHTGTDGCDVCKEKKDKVLLIEVNSEYVCFVCRDCLQTEIGD